jgi:hypothetical protein
VPEKVAPANIGVQIEKPVDDGIVGFPAESAGQLVAMVPVPSRVGPRSRLVRPRLSLATRTKQGQIRSHSSGRQSGYDISLNRHHYTVPSILRILPQYCSKTIMSNNVEETQPDSKVDETPISPILERRNTLEKQLEHRPDAQDLKNRNILYDSNAAP